MLAGAAMPSARAEGGESRLVGMVESIFAIQKLSIGMSALGALISGMAGVVVLYTGVAAGAIWVLRVMTRRWRADETVAVPYGPAEPPSGTGAAP